MKYPQPIVETAESLKRLFHLGYDPVRETVRKTLRGRGRYVGVAVVFAVATWYGTVVAPVSELKKDSVVSVVELADDMLRPDLEGDRPSKTYAGLFDSRPGDIYRIGICARAVDADETLRLVAVSELGVEREVATLSLAKANRETASEFLFRADGVYRTMIVRKEGETDADRWRGGRVAIPSFAVTRLEVASLAQAKTLMPTLSRQEHPDRIVAGVPDGAGKVSFPDKVSFEKWGIFRATGSRMLSVTFSIRQTLPMSDAFHRLELREYDPEARAVSGRLMEAVSFSEAQALSTAKNRGATVLDFPAKLEAGKWYAIGSVAETKDIPQVTFLDITEDSGIHGPFLMEMVPASGNPLADRLLSGAKIEDLGSGLLRYGYAPLRTAADFLDLEDASASVKFDSGNGLVTGRATAGEQFTYHIDTVYPFRELSVSAEQYRNDEDQIAIEYSFDGKYDWTAIPYVQDTDEPQEFAGTIEGDGTRDTVHIRVRYAGEKDEKRDFALSGFRVTASLAK